MKRIILFIIFFFSLLCIKNISAQDTFHLGFNGGYVFQGSAQGIFNAGKNAWTIRMNASYPLSQDIRIDFQTGYFNFPNYNVHTGGAVPDQLNVVLPPGANDLTILEKTSAKVYQVSAGITLISHYSQEFYPFVSIQSGILIFNNVTYNYPSFWADGSQLITLDIYSENQTVSLTKGFASLGIGLQIPITNKFGLNLEGVYSITFDKSNKTQDFIPLLCGVEYSF